MTTPPCRICATACEFHGEATVLQLHRVRYWRCPTCGYIQTDPPAWLAEAYGEPIAATDVGLVARNVQYTAVTQSLIHACFNSQGEFVDYGGGYGLLVRMLRDQGLNFRLWEPQCANLFAKGHETHIPNQPGFELVTAFEVFEHLADPRAELERMLKFSRNIFFSTRLIPDPAPRPSEWWYYCTETGQHVGLYTAQSLQHLARAFNLHFTTDGESLHLYSAAPVPAWRFKLVTRYRFACVRNALGRKSSLAGRDYEQALRTALSNR